ncbi:fucoxanthin chlorophyll a c [Aureococcus anophagefferens]|nr:fucoxanthin chlorophyll a c [Aureococcus anophagefferens]
MPFLDQPKNLDGKMAGDVGFDPLGLSEIDDLGIDLYWLREAEIKHGRVAMLAATGVLWVEIFGPLPGWPVADGRSQMDVFWDAFDEHPAIAAGLLFITIIEAISGVATTMGRETGERAPGDFGFNPSSSRSPRRWRSRRSRAGASRCGPSWA